MIGICGTMTYCVVQRTGELGIRRALGAPTGNILWLAVDRSLVATAPSLVVGIAHTSFAVILISCESQRRCHARHGRASHCRAHPRRQPSTATRALLGSDEIEEHSFVVVL